MKDALKMVDKAGMTMERNRGTEDDLVIQGIFTLEHWRDDVLLGVYEFKNLVVNAAKNNLLDVYFNSGIQTATASWFMGLISNAGFTAIAAGDTMASHAGWIEFTAYSETTRQLWTQGAASGQAITNSSPAVYNINGSGNVYGLFICTSSTKGGTSGILFSAAPFTAGVVPVTSGDVLRATYNLGT